MYCFHKVYSRPPQEFQEPHGGWDPRMIAGHSAMRNTYLVCYDIRDDKRLRRVHKICKAFGEPWQLSVFYCTLKSIDRVRLETALRETMNLKEDQVLIVDLGGNEDAARDSSTFLGVGVPEQESGMVVI